MSMVNIKDLGRPLRKGDVVEYRTKGHRETFTVERVGAFIRSHVAFSDAGEGWNLDTTAGEFFLVSEGPEVEE